MKRISHKQAGRTMRRELDGLLTDAQRRELTAHLDECETCRLESDSLSTLTARLQSGFHAKWDTQDSPSPNVMANVHSQTRRIIMSKRIDLAFNVFGGIVTLLVLAFVVSTVVSQFQKNTAAGNETQNTDNTTRAKNLPLIAFVSERNGNSEIYTVTTDGTNSTNLTNDPAEDTNPVWSPDGTRIAFVSDRDGNDNIYVMNFDGSNMIRLTDDPASDMNPVWSPDGTKIAYTSGDFNKRNTNIQVMDSNGQNHHRLTEYVPNTIVWHSLWSPDSQFIFFGVNRQIVRVNVNGGDVTPITPQTDANIPLQFVLSKDGSTLLYLANCNPNDIGSNDFCSLAKSIQVNGENEETKSTLKAVEICAAKQTASWMGTFMKWSPDQTKILFAFTCEENGWLYIANADGSDFKPLTNYPVLGNGPDNFVAMSDWSPDSQSIVFMSGLDQPDKDNLYLLNVNDALDNPATRPIRITNASAIDLSPAWQPAFVNPVTEQKPTPAPTQTSDYNALIAFASQKNGNPDIYTMHADGSNVINITNNPAIDTSPAWSPDGKSIAFNSDRTDPYGNPDIFVMNPDGKDLKQLTDNPGWDEMLSWSPDGRKIVYQANQGGHLSTEGQLIVMNPDGSNKVVLTKEAGSYSFLSWSPDGQKVIYQKESTDPNGSSANAGIYSVNIDGTNQRELFKGVGIGSMHWEDAGNFSGIVYTQLDNANWYLYRLNIDGQPAIQLGSSSTPIDGWFIEGSKTIYITKNTTTWFWHDERKKVFDQPKWNFASSCKDYSPKDVYQQDADHVLSPDGKYLFVTVTCNEGVSFFYLVSADGSEIKELANMLTPTAWQALDTTWSPDGKYVIMTSAVAFPNNRSAYMDFYLFDIEKMLNDPSTKPIQLTTDGAFKFSPGWQPQP